MLCKLKARVHAVSLSHVQLFATLWTVACQVPLSMGFSRQEYWSGLSFPSLRDLLDPGIKPASPVSLHWQADSLPQILSHLGSLEIILSNVLNILVQPFCKLVKIQTLLSQINNSQFSFLLDI